MLTHMKSKFRFFRRSSRVTPIMETKYCKETPSNQTAIDIFQGAWLSAFPEKYQVNAGRIRHFDFSVEPRVKWVDSILPSGLKGQLILELGPFEAYNTWQMEQLGAKSVTAIEANNLNYLKCLIVKETTGMKSRFLFGDFISYLEQCSERYDIVWASGVLYHQVEPLKLLGLISKVTDIAFIHTHYYVDEVIKNDPGLSANFIPRRNSIATHDGFRAKLHYRSYKIDKTGTLFAGGTDDFSYWMEKEPIFECLRHFGFMEFHIGVDDMTNPNGPAMFFLAKKTT